MQVKITVKYLFEFQFSKSTDKTDVSENISHYQKYGSVDVRFCLPISIEQSRKGI